LTLPQATPTSLTAFSATTNRITAGSYDSAGNLTALANLAGTMSYDAINKMTAFDNGDGTNPKTGQYFYDGAGNRIKRVASDSGASETVTYVCDAFGKLAAEYSSKLPTEPAGTLFRTTDHLGSTRLVTDAGQTIHTQGCRDFFPFGERIAKDVGGRSDSCYGGQDQDDALSQKFTGKERDVEWSAYGKRDR